MLACKEGKPNVVGAIHKTLFLLHKCCALSDLYKQTVEEGEEKGMNCLELATDHGHRYAYYLVL